MFSNIENYMTAFLKAGVRSNWQFERDDQVYETNVNTGKYPRELKMYNNTANRYSMTKERNKSVLLKWDSFTQEFQWKKNNISIMTNLLFPLYFLIAPTKLMVCQLIFKTHH